MPLLIIFWVSTKPTLSHQIVACSYHDMAGKLLTWH